jgi:hypothetical protein
MTTAKRLVPLLLAVPFVAAAVSCLESRHPLSDEKTSKVDERLIGAWLDEGGDLYTVRRGDPKKNHLNGEWQAKDTKDGSAKLLLFTTTLDSKHYMTVKDLSDDAEKNRQGAYDLYQYRFRDNDILEIRGMIDEVIEKAVAQKLLAGKAVKGEDPVITDSTEAITRYLKAHAAECYPEKTDIMMTFKRRK